MILPDGQGHLKSSTPLTLCWALDLSLARTHGPLAYLGLALSISTRQCCGWFSIHISCFSYLPCWGTLLSVHEIDWDTNSENPGRKTLFLLNKVLVSGSSQPYKENNSYTNLDNCFCLPNVSGQHSSGACELPHCGSLWASLKPQKAVKMATEGSAKSAQASLWQVLAHSSGSSSWAVVPQKALVGALGAASPHQSWLRGFCSWHCRHGCRWPWILVTKPADPEPASAYSQGAKIW